MVIWYITFFAWLSWGLLLKSQIGLVMLWHMEKPAILLASALASDGIPLAHWSILHCTSPRYALRCALNGSRWIKRRRAVLGDFERGHRICPWWRTRFCLDRTTDKDELYTTQQLRRTPTVQYFRQSGPKRSYLRINVYCVCRRKNLHLLVVLYIAIWKISSQWLLLDDPRVFPSAQGQSDTILCGQATKAQAEGGRREKGFSTLIHIEKTWAYVNTVQYLMNNARWKRSLP